MLSRFGLGEYAVLEVVDDLVRGPRALLRASFHEALEVDGAMLAGEMALSGGRVRLPRLLVATELRVLADLPVGVRAEEERIGERDVERGAAVPLRSDAREDRLDLGQERLGELGHEAGVLGMTVGGRQRPAAPCVVDQGARRAAL